MKKPKLVVYILERRKPRAQSLRPQWCLCLETGSIARSFWGEDKRDAVQRASRLVLGFYRDFDQHSELRVRNVDGTFAPARTYPRSADPKRSKG